MSCYRRSITRRRAWKQLCVISHRTVQSGLHSCPCWACVTFVRVWVCCGWAVLELCSSPWGHSSSCTIQLLLWALGVAQPEGPGLVILIGTAFMFSLLKDNRKNNPKGFSPARGCGQGGCLFSKPAAAGEGMLSMQQTKLTMLLLINHPALI